MKRKGFTLIELLAVIVILAVIALIATPMILNVIETARKGAAEVSANGYMEALEQQIMLSEVSGTKLKANETYNVTKGTELSGVYYISLNEYVNVKGSKPTGTEDYIKLNEKYQIEEALLTIEGYEIKIENGKIVTTEKGEIIELEDIELNSYNETMERGTSYTIVTSFLPNNASEQRVTYESSNTDIVEVDEKGLVTAKANGEAKVIVTTKGNKEKKKEITIKVISPSEVTGITLNTSEEIIGVGETYSLIATLEPMDATSNSLTWASSNPSVASVSDAGIITGLSIGESIISATTQSGLKAEMKVTVKYVVSLNEEKVYTTDSSVTFEDIETTSYTNVSCNNAAVPTYNSNTVTVSNITGNITCSLNATIAAINNMDNTKNTVLMINDETTSEIITIGENQNIEIDLNGKEIISEYESDTTFITNNGTLLIKDDVGTGSISTNYRLIMTSKNLKIESGNYIREGSEENVGGTIVVRGGNADLKNSIFTSDVTWAIYTYGDVVCELNIENSEINSPKNSAVITENQNSIINISNSNIYSNVGIENYYGEMNVNSCNIETSSIGAKNNSRYNLNITETTIESQWSYALFNGDIGTVTITNSNLMSSSTNGATVQNSSSGIINLNNSNVTHTYNESGTWRQVAVRNNTDGVININGGEYKSYANPAIYNNGVGIINIKSGSFYMEKGIVDGGIAAVISNNGTENGIINICGANLSSNVETNYDLANVSSLGNIKYKTNSITWINGTTPNLLNESLIIIDDTITCES